MPHISLNSDEPGIRGLFRFRPETARPLNELVEVLLRQESTLTPGERELIAAYVSALNECRYCYNSHAAYAAAQLPEGMELVEQVRADLDAAPISGKLRALLAIAGAVQQGGLKVGDKDVTAAREQGATDLEIHDTVLIAAAFCMFNRYVDGLATIAPTDPADYAARAERIVSIGYLGLLAQSQSRT
ncbi:carboxymuconolactone decarboxylase family protein [Sphaerisporangium corydalis]|uniref:Carboxymuconolactone decarboxylase family protein n=1 Tax=Sphaerisporangium corydalis TaxID=1441875 RepID=A0ABV9EDN4_9ACTN|nr:peroxidase-related enzyme [Sphaerisporangium corydalis]